LVYFLAHEPALEVPCFLFFFSSRRRHTRFSRDWSSDVCSSDLPPTSLLDSTSRFPARRGRTVAVMPAYNAAATIRQTVADIPDGSVDEIILVDDCSRDNTVEVARELGLTVIPHERNLGYGGNQKTCYRHALAAGADFVVMIHPDYQYDSRVIPAAVEFLRLGICD